MSGQTESVLKPDERAEWLKRVLGYNIALPSQAKKVSFSPVVTVIGSKPPPMIGSDRKRSDRKPGKPSLITGRPEPYDVGGGRSVEIIRGNGGRISFKAPPPPVGEITFSGGGGKGVALGGAVKGLAPIMKDVTVVKGASVGSLTASLMATGISPEEFKRVSDSEETTRRILEGRSQGGKMALMRGLTGNPLTGEGLYSVVREEMNKAAGKHIDDLWDKLSNEAKEELDKDDDDDKGKGEKDVNTGIEGVSLDTLREIKNIKEKIAKGDSGLTFKDLRTLHQAIPEIKEVEISATLMGDSSTLALSKEDLQQQNDRSQITESKRQLAMFNADTQPDMEVAKAAQASAALPPVFTPVDIQLDGGMWGKFMDGGVMNNAPSQQTVQSERRVDPMPPKGSITYTFQEDGDEEGEDNLPVLGKPTPGTAGRLDKKMLKAEHTAGEYSKNRLLADTPDDIVVVPLKFPVLDENGKPVRNWYGTKKTKDFSGLLSGTVNFDISQKSKDELQRLTEKTTENHLKKREQPKTTEFASAKQMLNCISESDLDGLVKQGFEGAREEQQFRTAALEKVKALIEVQGWDDPQLKAHDGKMLLGELEDLCKGDVDRLGFVARELGRSGRLDDFLKKVAEEDGEKASDVVKVGTAVVESFDAQAHAQNVLREVIYPRMVRKSSKPKLTILTQVDNMLRGAQSKEEVNGALDIAIKAFTGGKKPSKKDLEFAAECRKYKLAA